jgi:hypothetical protein
MSNNEFPCENNVLQSVQELAEHGGSGFRPSFHRSKPMRNPRPFAVIQNGKPLFTVTAYSIEQARKIVAAKVAGEVIIVAVTRDGAAK